MSAGSHVPDLRPQRQHTPPRGPEAAPSVRRASAEQPSCRQQRHVTRRISLGGKKKKKWMYVIEPPSSPPLLHPRPSPVRLCCPLSRRLGSAPGPHALLLPPGCPSSRCCQTRTYRRDSAVPRPPRRARGSGRRHPPGRPPPRTPRLVPALRCVPLSVRPAPYAVAWKRRRSVRVFVCVCRGRINFAQWRQGSSLSPSIRSIY